MRSKKRNTNLNILREQIKNLEVSDKDPSVKSGDKTIKSSEDLLPIKTIPKLKGRIKDQLINTSRLLTFDG
jgi:hypothetical protein